MNAPVFRCGAMSILQMIAADPNVSPALAAAIAIPGSDRWQEVQDEERVSQLEDERRDLDKEQ